MTAFKCTKALSLLCILVTSPLLSAAEKQYRVGFLVGSVDWDLAEYVPPHLEGSGYYRNENIEFKTVWSGGSDDLLPELAVELIDWNPDVIVTADAKTARAVADATTTIPIVTMVLSDPVKLGLVDSLSRPGRNITGVIVRNDELIAKKMELLKELVTELKHVCVVFDPSSPNGSAVWRNAQAIASRAGLTLVPAEIDLMDDEVTPALQGALEADCESMWVIADMAARQQNNTISKFAVEHRLPTLYDEFTYLRNPSGLMSYGPDLLELRLSVARVVDKILKGVDPATYPMQRMTLFELVVSPDTAKAIGMEIPQSILVRAKRIEGFAVSQ
jgi:putative ABC transport system substrate-binding protein